MPIAVLLGGMFLSNVDIAVVNTATPAIRSGLAASAGEVELIVSAYTLAFAVLLVFCARLGGLYGFGRVYRVGLAVFVLASLACGLATGPWLLIVARVVQGAGAALLVAQVLTGIQVMSTGRQRTRALGAYTIVLAGSAVIGQVLGGLIVSANLFGTSWRPVFLLNVPLGIALFALCRTLPVGRSTTAAGRLDYPGAALLTVALGLLVFFRWCWGRGRAGQGGRTAACSPRCRRSRFSWWWNGGRPGVAPLRWSGWSCSVAGPSVGRWRRPR
ncbi:MFS transporter [Fodinicola feengrottensis]|uniref:MFS transporter n=1 Tax=Fodinicola feengrottensis TaxID=435914 RepID=UPI0013D647CC|nr:MFS transporter [Fodinicola feengrottensis]